MAPGTVHCIEQQRFTRGRSRIPPPGRAAWAALAVAGTLCVSATAQAQEADTDDQSVSTIGLDPSVPQVGTLPGGITPAYGQRPLDEGDWRFDYHGLLTAPLRIGLNTRDDPDSTQSRNVMHSPPVVPDDLETFSHTGVVPSPYAQLNFTYGNNIVTGNVSIVAREATIAAGFFDPPSQLGVNDLFLRLTPDFGPNVRMRMYFGAFSNRYGSPGEYDEGRYGTPLIARVNGVGENIGVALGLGDLTLLLEQGLQGLSNYAPRDITPDGWNEFADPSVGSSFVHHFHAGLGYGGVVTLAGHYLWAWSQDDRATGTLLPDGSIGILGTDLRLTMGRFGHLYFAAAQTDAEYARTVGRIVEVLNTRGGPSLMQNYLGPNSQGTGKLTTLGGQYDLSLGRLVSYPVPFNLDGPDFLVSLFGARVHVQSEDPDYDGITKYKVGLEGAYSLLSWLAASVRWDRVAPNIDNDRYSFSVVSPRLIFRSDWTSTDQLVLQYSHWFNGSLTTVRTGYPPEEDVTVIPDEDMVSLSASMWW
jgi:hypothetical protein